jgi:ankyrin repeat protein
VYKGDSFGDHSYINPNEGRECSPHCGCRLHEKPEAFTFIAYKTPTQLAITFHSIGLYSELFRTIDLQDMQLEATSQGAVVNGLVLLKHYRALSARLNALRSTSPTEGLLISEMTLLVRGFLLDGDVFKSYGYENLYEDGFLTFDHWKDFQQVQLERDITALEEAYYAIDDTDYFGEESPMPQAQAVSPDPQAEELHSGRICTGGTDIIPLLSDPSMASASDAQPLRCTLPSSETEMQFAPPLIGATVEDRQEGRPPLDPGTALEELLDPALLTEAAEAGHESIVRSLLDRGADVEGSGTGLTPLVKAAKAGHESVVRLLLDRGADVEASNSFLTPLFEAIEAGHESVVRLLLDQGAAIAIDHFDEFYNSTPLIKAAKKGHEPIVRLLLDRKAAVDGIVNSCSTPLIEAAKAGHMPVVQLLLDRGAAVNGIYSSHSTPLIEAAKAGHESVVQLLLDRGAAVNNSLRAGISTPLLEAVNGGHDSVARLLLHRGAVIDTFSCACNETSLTKAAGAGCAPVDRLGLDQEAAVSSFHPLSDPSPLVEAAKAGHESRVRSLLDLGAAVNGPSCLFSSTPLVEAARAGHESVVRLLLDRGAAIDHSNKLYSSMPLVEAVKAGHQSVVRSLLDLGAAVNGCSCLCSPTPLAEAAKAGHESIVRLLLDRGAAIDYSNKLYKSVVRLLLYDTPGRQRQSLYKSFGKQHLKLTEEAKHSLTGFRDLGSRFLVRREMWAHGVNTLRRLCNGKPPRGLDDTIAFLCVSRAISETLDGNGNYDYTNKFLQDLDRWQILSASDITVLLSYREAVQMMWGVVLNKNMPRLEQASKLETLTYFQSLASTMVSQEIGLPGFRSASNRGLERSQQRWRLRESRPFRNGEHSTSFSNSQTQPSTALNSKPPDPPVRAKENPLHQEINRDNSSAKMSPIAVLLMAGAIFAMVIFFLTCPSTTPQPDYRFIVYTVLTPLVL